MSKESLVSIIMATYNQGIYIKKAVESASSQTYKNKEIIVVDDGSTDNTKKVLLPFIKDKKIKYIYQENSGSALARNKAIDNAQGEYIAILDADDIWIDRDKLKKQIEFLEKNNEYILVGGGMIIVDINGREIKKCLPPETDAEIRKSILIRNPFVHSAVVFKREIWQLTNGYIGRKKVSTDEWSLWLELGKLGKFYNFPEYFIYYLKNPQGTSKKKQVYNLREDIKIRKKYRTYYPNFWKGYFYGWLQYFYFFFPFKKQLYPIISGLKRIIF